MRDPAAHGLPRFARVASSFALLSALSLMGFAAFASSVLGCENLNTGAEDGGSAANSSDGGVTSAEAGFVGGGCGKEQNSGAELCIATSMCPSVVVDTQAMPSCGFRVRGGVVDLVCACGTSLCPMGVFSTCSEATQLLANQTEPGVCLQVAEGRCSEATASPPTSASSSGGNPACDQQCVKDCGGGEACATICNCK